MLFCTDFFFDAILDKSLKSHSNGGHQSTFVGNSTLLPAQRFWRETVSVLDVM